MQFVENNSLFEIPNMLMGFAEIVINVTRSIIRDSCFLGDHKMKLIVGYSCYKISLVVIGSTQISIGAS